MISPDDADRAKSCRKPSADSTALGTPANAGPPSTRTHGPQPRTPLGASWYLT